jgi:prepilin-type N-terminal cleavage/methylation domain-containing protein
MFSLWSERFESRTVRSAPDAARRRGFTLLELLIALSIMLMVVGTLGGIARAIQMAFAYNEGYGTVTQHGRVVLERITRTARQAAANEAFPGFVVLADRVGRWRFPDTLVVWHPDGPPAAWEGLPRLDELVVYCPHPDDPERLVEITTDDVQFLSDDKADWPAQIEALKSSPNRRVTTLTGLLRAGSVGEAGGGEPRGAIQFETRLRPSDAEWSEATRSWKELSWVQRTHGPTTGLRQAWLRIELQLVTEEAAASGAGDRQVVPFFGSAARYYTMNKDHRP